MAMPGLDSGGNQPLSHWQMREIVLGANEAPKRIEAFLKKHFPIGYVRKLFRKNGVRINGKRAKAEEVIGPGDRVQLYLPFEADAKESSASGRAAKLQVIFEDDAILVLNKPAGVAVQEGKSVSRKESLLGLLQAKYRDRNARPQLIHRLDKDTSGLLLVAKNSEIAKQLEGRFGTGEVAKIYLGLVVGRLPEDAGEIAFPLPGREGSPVRALTRYRVVKRFSETTLVRVRIMTGRLHQIRLHFAKLGHPVVMDEQHGDFGFNKRFRKRFGLKRQFLHAETLTIDVGGKPRQWTAPLAEELSATLELLGNVKP